MAGNPNGNQGYYQPTIPIITARGHYPSSSNSNNSVHNLCSKFIEQTRGYQRSNSNDSGNRDSLENLVTKYMDNNTSITTTEAIIWAISITYKDGKFYKMDEPVKYDMMIDLIQDSNKLFDYLPVKMGNVIFPLTENIATLFDILASTNDVYVSLMISIIMSSTTFKYNFRDNANFPFDIYKENDSQDHYIKFTYNSGNTKYNGSVTNYTFIHERNIIHNLDNAILAKYTILVHHDKVNYFGATKTIKKIETSKQTDWRPIFQVKVSPDCIGKLEDYFMHDINLEMYGHVESITKALKIRKEQYFKELQEEVNTELNG